MKMANQVIKSGVMRLNHGIELINLNALDSLNESDHQLESSSSTDLKVNDWFKDMLRTAQEQWYPSYYVCDISYFCLIYSLINVHFVNKVIMCLKVVSCFMSLKIRGHDLEVLVGLDSFPATTTYAQPHCV